MNQLDLTKPLITCSGYAVKYIGSNPNNPQYPILGVVGNSQVVYSWDSYGKFNTNSSEENDYDILNAAEEKTMYLNIYPVGHCYLHNSLEEALKAGKGNTIEARIKVTYKPGQFE